MIAAAFVSGGFVASAAAGSGFEASVADWNVLVYLTADNNLDSLAQADLDELMAVGSTESVNVLALVDRLHGPAYLYMVLPGALAVEKDFYLNGQEVNMGSAETLAAFVGYCEQQYPAAMTLLFFWDHGSAVHGVGVDDNTGEDGVSDWLSHWEVLEAVDGYRVDVIATDECLIGQVEVAYEYFVGGLDTEYLIASEGYISWRGFPYDDILSRLVADSDMSALELSLVIVDEYTRLFSVPPYMSEILTVQAVIKLDEALGLAADLRALTELLMADMDKYRSAITSAAARSLLPWGETGGEGRIDLATFVQGLRDGVREKAVKAACDAVLESFGKTVLALGKTKLTDTFNFRGLGVLFPPSYQFLSNALTSTQELYGGFAFADEIWLDFLYSYWGLERT